jgi:hypothetical protein
MMIRLHIDGTRPGGRRLADVRPSEVQAWATDRSRVLAPTTLRQAVGLRLMPDSDDRTRSAVDAAWDAVGASCAPDVPQDALLIR